MTRRQKQLDMDLDGSRKELQDQALACVMALRTMDRRIASILEALDRRGITVKRHELYGWQWQVGNHGGRTDTLPDAIDDALKAVQL